MIDSDDAAVLIIGIFAVISFVATPAAMVTGFGAPQDPSEYRGEVVDFTNEHGLVMETSSVEIKTSPTSSTSERFCIHPENRGQVLPDLRRAQENDHRVTITYIRPLFAPLWDCSYSTSGRIVTDVTVHGGESE